MHAALAPYLGLSRGSFVLTLIVIGETTRQSGGRYRADISDPGPRNPSSGPMAPRKKTTMSDEHEAALAEERSQGRAVRRDLEALESAKPQRGRKRTPDTVNKCLAVIDASFADATPVGRLELVEERTDLQREVTSLRENVDLSALEAEFVNAAGGYAERKGISFPTFRAVGVPAAATLKAARIPRSS